MTRVMAIEPVQYQRILHQLIDLPCAILHASERYHGFLNVKSHDRYKCGDQVYTLHAFGYVQRVEYFDFLPVA